MTCPQPKACACGEPLPARQGRGGRNREYCDTCRPRSRVAIVRRSRQRGCPHCPHCAAEAARVVALEEVAQELERQEWRAAAAAVRNMARTAG